MAEPRRLVHLPGYDDTARDIYETPDLTDDTSTTLTQPTSAPSPSESSDTSDEDDGQKRHGVSRRRLFPERARSRFHSVQAVGKNVDLSDRVDGRRRGYRVRRRSGEEEEEEGLEARIARLRKEVEECRVEAESELDFGGRDQTAALELEGLSKVLAGFEETGRRRKVVQDGAVVGGGAGGAEEEVPDEQVLKRVADFDSRLAALEQALGISALDSATTDATTTPVLPSLTLLDQQLAALSAAGSLTNLETAGARIQKLKLAADQLAQPASRPSTRSAAGEEEAQPPALSQDDMDKLQSLYQLLPTLQSLSPSVPALLTRLRSLRTLHTQAATAAQELDELEKRQSEMDVELKEWRDGLEKVEAAVAAANEANGKNGVFVEGWVKEIEGRLKAIAR